MYPRTITSPAASQSEDKFEIIFIRFGHKLPTKPQLSPHKHREIHFGAKVKVAPEEVTIPSLDAK